MINVYTQKCGFVFFVCTCVCVSTKESYNCNNDEDDTLFFLYLFTRRVYDFL